MVECAPSEGLMNSNLILSALIAKFKLQQILCDWKIGWNNQARDSKLNTVWSSNTWGEITLVLERMGAARSSSISTTCSWPLLAPQCSGVRPSYQKRQHFQIHLMGNSMNEYISSRFSMASKVLWISELQIFTHVSHNIILFFQLKNWSFHKFMQWSNV